MLIADAIKEGDFYGMQTFDQALLKLYEDGPHHPQRRRSGGEQPARLQALVQQQGHDVSLMSF